MSDSKQSEPPEHSAERRRLVERARKIWSDQLIDTGARNNLLYYRDLPRGTLDLASADPRWVSRLLRGERLKLSGVHGEDPDGLLADAVKRVQTINARALEHLEERGLRTLHLGCGLATWEQTGTSATPRSPVLLRRLGIHPVGGAQQEFELQLEEEMEVNPTLLHVLASQFEVTVDQAALLNRLDGEIDTQWELAEVYRWLETQAQEVPGFAIEERIVAGTFAYAKLPMVTDLAESLDVLLDSDLIAAIAGDEEARGGLQAGDAAVEVDIRAPDHTPPEDEFLILDADASQQYAINAVVAGKNLIIKGPPGTGKSQTISNLVSTLVARGLTVLFVAEKRAAIDAVVTRLERAGLENLVFDLHSETKSRRKLAARLSEALDDVRRSTLPDHAETHDRLTEVRATLKAHDEALHEIREPWGRTLYEIQAGLIGLPGSAKSEIRFRGATLAGLDAQTARAEEAKAERYAALGGTTLSGSAKPWAEARVATQEEATRARDLLHELRGQLLPRANKAFERCCQESGIPGPATISERGGHLSIWNEVAVHMEDATPEIYDTDLASLARDLEKARDGGLGRITASLFSGTYKRARDTAKGLLRVEVDDARALSLIEASDSQVDRWQGLGGRGRPNAPAHLHDAVLSHDALVNGLVELGDVLSRDDLVSMPPEGLSGVLVALEADEATLAILPELHRLHSELSEAGLGDLRDLLVERRVDADGARDAFRFAWLTSVLDEIRFTDPRVGTFSPENLDRSLATFQASDRSHIQTTAERVRRRYAERVTAARDANPTESALLQREANKRRGHLPLRKLVERAPKVLVSLKPCWAVSPLLVSQVLPADMRFDVVVFDEASQVSPADAVTSIMRGDRTVVAGDDRQLPPTAFFTSTTAEDELDDEGGIVDATQGFESILDVASAYIPFRMLGWHYRSLDERLISFSNAHVYDGGLTTFPGIGGEAPIRHELVDHGAPTGGADSSVHEVNRVVELVIAHAEERPSESLGVIALGIKHAERIEEALRLALTMRRDLDDFFDEDREERFFVKNLERVQGDEREAIILSIGYAKGQDGRLRHQFGPINLEGGERRLNVAVTRARRRMTLVSSFSASDIDPNRSSSRGVALLRQYLQFADSRGDYLGDHAPEHPPLNPFEIDVRDTLAAEGIPLTPQLGASGYFIDFAAGHPDRPGDFVLAIECDGASYHSAPTARDRDRLRQQQLERLGWRFHRIWSTDWFNEKRAATERAVRAWRHAAEATDDERRGASPVPPPVSPSGGGDAGARDDNGLGADSAPIPEQGGALRIAADEQLHLSDSATSAPQRASRDGGCPIPPGQPITAYSQSQLRALVRWIKSDTRLRTREELLDEAMRALGFRRRGARIVEALNKAIVAEDRAPSGKQ